MRNTFCKIRRFMCDLMSAIRRQRYANLMMCIQIDHEEKVDRRRWEEAQIEEEKKEGNSQEAWRVVEYASRPLLLSREKSSAYFTTRPTFEISSSPTGIMLSRSGDGESSRNRSLEFRETFSTSYNRKHANLWSLFKYFFLTWRTVEDLGFHSFCREWRKEGIFLKSVWLRLLWSLFYTR